MNAGKPKVMVGNRGGKVIVCKMACGVCGKGEHANY